MLFVGTVALKQEIAFSSESIRGMAYQLFWIYLLGFFLIRLLYAMGRQLVHSQSKS